MPKRAWRLLAIVVLSKPFSNLFLAWGMKAFPEALTPAHPALFLRAIFEPMVTLGIVTQIVWLLSRMALLGIADLSFVLPVTAFGYVLTTALGRIFLHEDVSLTQWAATGLIFLGTALVTSTPATSAGVRSTAANSS